MWGVLPLPAPREAGTGTALMGTSRPSQPGVWDSCRDLSGPGEALGCDGGGRGCRKMDQCVGAPNPQHEEAGAGRLGPRGRSQR